jgi:hypothetical protein
VKRRLFNAGALLSLAICLASLGLWVRSGGRAATLQLGPSRLGAIYATAAAGGLTLVFVTEPDHIAFSPLMLDTYSAVATNPLTRFSYHRRDAWMSWSGYFPQRRVLTFPIWVVSIVSAATPLLWVHRRTRRRASGPGMCAACGYDLRGTPGSQCPECGAGYSSGGKTNPT